MSEVKKVIMLGNEAIARGAYEAGVKVSAAYPGTPSTEISENLVKYKDDLYCEWSPNEKVATEVAIGASVAGVRAMSCMKHVGFNVAADPAYPESLHGHITLPVPVNVPVLSLCEIQMDDQTFHSDQMQNSAMWRLRNATWSLQRQPIHSQSTV